MINEKKTSGDELNANENGLNEIPKPILLLINKFKMTKNNEVCKTKLYLYEIC